MTAVARPQVAFTAEAAAEVMGVSKETILRAVKAGKLRGKRSGANGGGLYLFSLAQLQEWFDGLEDA